MKDKEKGIELFFTKEDLALAYEIGFNHGKHVTPFQQKEVVEAFCKANNWYKNIDWD